ncbi:hypothetical protein BF28_5622 (plasmid) [Bacillus cereus E33L]|nr:hypothetical protein BF28_5622 [Bacillus cereus E33L]
MCLLFLYYPQQKYRTFKILMFAIRVWIFLKEILMEEAKVVYALIKNKYNQILMVDNHEGHGLLPGGKVE